MVNGNGDGKEDRTTLTGFRCDDNNQPLERALAAEGDNGGRVEAKVTDAADKRRRRTRGSGG